LWRSVAKTVGVMLASQQSRSKYTPLLDTEPDAEMGLTPESAAAPAPAPAAAAAAAAAGPLRPPISQLSKALKESRRASQAVVALGSQQQQQDQQGGMSYKAFMDSYEERCEAVLTKVYQSMFKVKEHVALSESEVRILLFQTRRVPTSVWLYLQDGQPNTPRCSRHRCVGSGSGIPTPHGLSCLHMFHPDDAAPHPTPRPQVQCERCMCTTSMGSTSFPPKLSPTEQHHTITWSGHIKHFPLDLSMALQDQP
jgi:hypothetical protein